MEMTMGMRIRECRVKMGFDADVMQLAMMLQEMKNEDVRKVAIEQVTVEPSGRVSGFSVTRL